LVLLATGVATACTVLLSATLIQGRLLTLAIDGVPVGIQQLAYAASQWNDLNAEIRAKSTDLEVVKNKNDELDAKVALLDLRTKALESLLSGFYHRIESGDGILRTLAGLIHTKGYDDQLGSILGVREQLKMQHPELESTISTIEMAYESWRAATNENETVEAERKSLQLRIKDLAMAIETLKKSQAAIFDSIKPNLNDDVKFRFEAAFLNSSKL
jgi:chromosome segregation ATPase